MRVSVQAGLKGIPISFKREHKGKVRSGRVLVAGRGDRAASVCAVGIQSNRHSTAATQQTGANTQQLATTVNNCQQLTFA